MQHPPPRPIAPLDGRLLAGRIEPGDRNQGDKK
jgi:hypothetical protein